MTKTFFTVTLNANGTYAFNLVTPDPVTPEPVTPDPPVAEIPPNEPEPLNCSAVTPVPASFEVLQGFTSSEDFVFDEQGNYGHDPLQDIFEAIGAFLAPDDMPSNR